MKIKSSLVCWLCALFLLAVGFLYYPRWEKDGGQSSISYDVSGYYMYLPATFIYHDLKHCNFLDTVYRKKYGQPDYAEVFNHPSGNVVAKYSSGQALMMLPAFTITHLITKYCTNYPADGYSQPYTMGIGVGMLLYALVGLYFLRKVLLEFYPDWVVSLTLLILVVGTNYLNYSAIDTTMTHSALFTVYTVMMYCCVQFYKKPGKKYALFIGLLAGLMILTRPTEIICLLLPLLWNVSSFPAFKERISFLLKNVRYILLVGLGILCLVSIQLTYWKFVSGDWIVYSYQDQGFSWKRPHVYDYALSYRCGWLRLCPVMVFAFVGIIPFIRRKTNTFAILSFFLLDFYIVCAWDIWDYGGVSGRAMIQSYPVLLFCLAALILWVHQKRVWAFLFYPVVLFCMYINIWWTHNAHRGTVQVMDMSKYYYWAVLGKWSIQPEMKKYLDHKYIYWGEPKKPQIIYQNDFSSDTTAFCHADSMGNKRLMLTHEWERTPDYSFPYTPSTKKWIRAYADFECQVNEGDPWRMAQFNIVFYRGGDKIEERGIRVNRFLNEKERKNIYIDMRVPDEKFDRVAIFFANTGAEKTMLIDNLKVVALDE